MRTADYTKKCTGNIWQAYGKLSNLANIYIFIWKMFKRGLMTHSWMHFDNLPQKIKNKKLENIECKGILVKAILQRREKGEIVE